MSYAKTIAEMSDQLKAEVRKCEEQRHIMVLEFFEQIRKQKAKKNNE